MLLSSLLFLFISFSSSIFDRYEKIHSNKEKCPDLKTTDTLSVEKNNNNDRHYVDCDSIGKVSFSSDSFSSEYKIAKYLFAGSSVTAVDFAEISSGLTISEGAFSYCKYLKGFDLTKINGEIIIEEGAFFKCEGLTSIKFPAKTISIGKSSFEQCTKLVLDFPKGMTIYEISSYAFYECTAITKIDSLKVTEKIDDYAFAKCTNLILQGTIEANEVGDYSFYGCQIKDLTIKCPTVGKHAFHGNGNIKAFDKTITVYNFGSYAFDGLKLPSTLEFKECTFKPYVFANCDLTDVKVITITGAIPNYCFDNPLKLNNEKCDITLGSGSIGKHSFKNFGKFQLTLNKEGVSPFYKISAYAFYNSGLEGNLLIPSVYTNIGTRAFAETNFKNLTIDNKEIGSYAFQGCKINGLVRILGSKIGESAFEKCDSIIQLVIGYKDTDVTTEGTFTSIIGRRAFYGVPIKGSLYIHSYVKTIEEYAFATDQASSSSSITNVNIFAAEIKPFAFSNAGIITNLNIYSKEINFHAFDDCNITNLVINYKDPLFDKANYPCIKEQAFYGLHISKLEISNEYIIEKSAFQRCNFVEQCSLTIKAKTIKSYAFASCKSQNDCTVEIGDCNIEDFAFMDFSKIKELSFTAEKECIIGDYTFIGSVIQTDKFKVLTFPSSVTSIGVGAFANISTLTKSISIESAYINDFAFEGCRDIETLELKEKVTYIGEKAFFGTGIEGDLVIPRSVTEINSRSFEKLKLNSITLYSDSKLESIGESAFGYTLISGPLQIPYNVHTIEGSAFRGCNELTSLMFYYGGSLQSIGEYAFADCSKIDCNLDIPTSVTEIGDYAFANCRNIKGHITLSLLCKIGNEAFQNCKSIKSITIKTNFDGTTGITKIKENSFKNVDIFGSIIIPPSIKEIGDSAFEGCKDITDIQFNKDNNEQILSNLERIGNKAFYQAGISGTLEIPDSVTEIGVSAFEGCKKLTYLVFKQRSEELTIGSLAFSSSGLISIYNLPSASIGDHAFANCLSLNEVYIVGGTLGTGIFQGCTNTEITINIQGRCKIGESAFEGLVTTKEFTLSISATYRNSIEIGNRAFYGSSIQFEEEKNGITNKGITFTNAVSYIRREAFSHCQNINGYLTLNGAKVGDGSFSYSSFAGKLQILSELDYSFGESTFRGCSGFSSLDISGLKSVPARAFYKMSFFEGTLQIPATCSFIGEYAFAGCSFEEVKFLDLNAVVEIERGAFSGIPTMVEIQYPTGIATRAGETKMRDFMFYECTSLSSFNNLQDYNEIGKYAFYGCKNLNMKLDFTKITSIGTGAFQGCSNLRGSLVIPASLTRIEDNAFADCTGLSGSLTINVYGTNKNGKKTGETYIGTEAFKGCTGFKKGTLTIFVEENEDIGNLNSYNYYKFNYFLRIGHDAFKDCKFKNIYYNGRFQPDCDYDLGIPHTKAIHTSSNYVNKSFCSYPLHHDKLSGGAIAGITIAVIIVVAAIVVLVVYFIIRNKKNKDQSEDEVEMNADP